MESLQEVIFAAPGVSSGHSHPSFLKPGLLVLAEGEINTSIGARRQEGGRHQGHSLDFIANCLLWESGVHEHQARGWGGFMTKKA